MPQIEDPKLFRIPATWTLILWLLALVFTLVPLGFLVTGQDKSDGHVATIGSFLIGLFSVYMALRASLWKVRFSSGELEWHQMFSSRKIPFSNVESFESETRAGSKGGRSGYFIVKLKSGGRIESPPLSVKLASDFADRAKKHMGGT